MIDFNLTKHNMGMLKEKLSQLDNSKIWRVIVTPFEPKRSTDHNEYYWKMIAEMANYFGLDSREEMHEVLTYKLLGKEKQVKNIKITTIASTSKMTKKEFKEYIEDVKAWAADYGFRFDYE